MMNHEQAMTSIERFFEDGALPPEVWQSLRVHLRSCDACRAEYDRLARVESALSSGSWVPRARVDRMLAVGAPGGAADEQGSGPGTVVRLFPRVAAPLLAAAAALILFVSLPDDGKEGFRARGGARGGEGAWITPYFVDGAGRSKRLEDELPKGSPLLFAYTALEETPYRYVAIVGLDASGRAHWYHPAYTDAGANPKSIPIEPGRADVELEEEVIAEHAAGALEICALFTEAPLSVKSVDRELEATKRWPGVGARDCHEVEVVGE